MEYSIFVIEFIPHFGHFKWLLTYGKSVNFQNIGFLICKVMIVKVILEFWWSENVL